MDANMLNYYGRRAAVYERIYQKPERQADLQSLASHLRDRLKNRRVLELACGTGYWTAAVADAAASIRATDASEDVLAIARSKGLDPIKVSFAKADAWRATDVAGIFDTGFAAFWWSHIPRERLNAFLGSYHKALQRRARVLFVDNRYVPRSSTPITRTDASGNTYQIRRLDDGSQHEVLKNFPSRDEPISTVEKYAQRVECMELTYFWCLEYELKEA